MTNTELEILIVMHLTEIVDILARGHKSLYGGICSAKKIQMEAWKTDTNHSLQYLDRKKS